MCKFIAFALVAATSFLSAADVGLPAVCCNGNMALATTTCDINIVLPTTLCAVSCLAAGSWIPSDCTKGASITFDTDAYDGTNCKVTVTGAVPLNNDPLPKHCAAFKATHDCRYPVCYLLIPCSDLGTGITLDLKQGKVNSVKSGNYLQTDCFSVGACINVKPNAPAGPHSCSFTELEVYI